MKIENLNDTIRITGLQQLDKRRANHFYDEVSAAMPINPGRIEIDLAGITSVDCTGLSTLVTIQDDARQRNPTASLQLLDPSPSVRQLLELTRMNRMFPVVKSTPSKKSVLPLFVFIDACGWEIIRNDPFVADMAPHRRPLRSVFGYSSACIPSILSGRWPDEHRNWCYFVRDPENSPFRALRALRWLPHWMTSRRIFRRYLSKLLRGPLKFKGYFDLYNIPFKHISLFDFTEKKNPLQPGGMNSGPNIFDFLVERGIPYHVSKPAAGERENLQALMDDIQAQSIDFAFLYWPALDGLMHMVGNDSPLVPEKLREYESMLQPLLAAAKENYDEVRLYIFSDHGMANCDQIFDLKALINFLPIEMPADYTVVYDSTMARFWFANEQARQLVTDCLEQVKCGRILEDEELENLGTLFPDRYFGELIFLIDEGVLIVPSDMGERPLRAMHGYHPDDPHSFASLLTNVNDVSGDITDIPHMHWLMARDAELAHAANNAGKPAVAVAIDS